MPCRTIAIGGSFAISRMQMPWVAQAVLLGGNVRVGLEDNLYLSKGVYASNAQLVERARTIIEAIGARVLTPRKRVSACSCIELPDMTELPVYHVKIEPEWIDFNGHVRDAYYGLAGSYAVDACDGPFGLGCTLSRAHTTALSTPSRCTCISFMKSRNTDDLQDLTSASWMSTEKESMWAHFPSAAAWPILSRPPI